MFFETQNEELNALYQKKQKNLLNQFSDPQNPQKTYEKIIELGKTIPPSKEDIKKEANVVEGCQSLVYLSSEVTSDGVINYQIQSDALISSGLAALLFSIYDKEKIELILFYPPLFIQELGLNKSLSPGRSNGLAGMYARMKRDAVKYFIEKQKVNKNTSN